MLEHAQMLRGSHVAHSPPAHCAVHVAGIWDLEATAVILIGANLIAEYKTVNIPWFDLNFLVSTLVTLFFEVA